MCETRVTCDTGPLPRDPLFTLVYSFPPIPRKTPKITSLMQVNLFSLLLLFQGLFTYHELLILTFAVLLVFLIYNSES